MASCYHDFCDSSCKLTLRHIRGINVGLIAQLVMNLTDPKGNRHILQGDAMDEIELERGLESFDTHSRFQLNRFRIYAAFWFKEYKLVVKIMEDLAFHEFSFEKVFPGSNGIATLYFHCALSCISVARMEKKQAKQSKRAKSFLQRIKTWTKKGNPNTQHYESLIESELASNSRDPYSANKRYEVAILLAGRWGFINDHARAHERFADHWRRLGNDIEARYHYNLAIGLYTEWGAHAVVETLWLKLADYMVPIPVIETTEVSRTDFSVLSMHQE